VIPWAEVLSRIPFEALSALDDGSVRFAYPQPLEVPLCWAMVLEDEPELGKLLPDAPNRPAVASLFEGLRHALYESFERGRGSALFATAGIDEPVGWRDVLLDHHCRPKWLYTNGQVMFSLVERPGPRYEVAKLPSLSSLHEFRTVFVRELLDPRDVMEFGHLDGAETYLLGRLAEVQVRTLPLVRGKERRTLLLRACGTRPGGPSERMISLWLAHVGGEAMLLETQAERRDAYTVLNELPGRLAGEVVQACATCVSFRFSGMSRGSSGGTRGYCRKRLEAARASGLPMPGMDVRPRYGTIVSVFDRCLSHEPIADADREVPFCRHERS
jgi:hypothetical protein